MIPTLIRCTALLAAFGPSVLLAVTVSVGVGPTHCGQSDGFAIATANGGLPPYTFLWSNGAVGETINGLVPGDYTVTVTDGLGNTAEATGTVLSSTALNQPFATELRSDCQSSCSGWSGIEEASFGGTPPYTYDFPGVNSASGYATFMGVCGSFPGTTVTATDAGGCSVTFGLMVGDSPGGWPDIDYILPDCGGSSNGVVALLDNYFSGAWYKVSNATFDSIYEFVAPPYIITGLPAGTFDIVLWDPSNPMIIGGGPVYCTFETEVTVPSIAAPCGSVSGTVYNDVDEDCVLDPTDYPLPYRVMTIEPGPVYAISDANGEFIAGLPQGSYTLTQPLVEEEQLCPAAHPVPFTLGASLPDAIVDLADHSLALHDIAVSVHPGSNARPGFPTSAYVVVTNTSPYPSGTVTITLTYDPLLLNPSPASAQWTVASIPPFSSGTYFFNALVPANINLLGTVLFYNVTATNSISETNTTNNTASASVTITGSYDPNFKEAHTSSGIGDGHAPSVDLYFQDADDWIDYTVHFQNTGTAAAETVVVRDTLDADWDITSLEILGSSHPFTPSFGQARELVFTFDAINLPDSTSDLLGSQGFVSYRIKPVADVMIGAMLENTAGIYFDSNPAIVTNTAQHQVSVTVGIANTPTTAGLQLYPNPANDVLYVNTPHGTNGAFDVLTVDGRKVNVPTFRTTSGLQLDVRALPTGVYVLRSTIGVARFSKH